MKAKYRFFLKKNIFAFFSIVLLSVSLSSQEYSYVDKFFGKKFVFTSNKKKICVKFKANASFSEIQDIINQQALSLETEGLEQLHYGVFSLPNGVTFEGIKDQLVLISSVVDAIPVFIDQEGFERYIDPEWFTVQFQKELSEKAIEGIVIRWGSTIAIKHWTPGYYTVTIPEGLTLFEAIRNFMEWPEVMFTEPVNYGFNDLLQDTYLDDQWHLQNTEQVPGYTPGNDINAFPAWDITLGDPNVIIVIIDTGIDQTHPDLEDNILPRENEDWDFSSPGVEPIDNNGHGTAVSGIAAGVMNNIGVRGVAPGCKLMPLKVNLTSGMNQNRADAINYAVDRRSDFTRMVISCSWGLSSGDFTAVHATIQNAVNNNVPIFFSAGNNN